MIYTISKSKSIIIFLHLKIKPGLFSRATIIAKQKNHIKKQMLVFYTSVKEYCIS